MVPRIQGGGKPPSEAEISDFEQRFGIVLPAEYRQFLLAYNGGAPVPDRVCRRCDTEPTEVCQWFLGLGKSGTNENLAGLLEELRAEKWPKRFVPIGADPFGNYFCLAVGGKSAGGVYFWNHEDYDEGAGAFSLLAKSFSAFLESFAEDPEEPAEPPHPPWVPLIQEGDADGLRQWLRDGGNLADVHHGSTPLATVLTEGRDELVSVLLEGGLALSDTIRTALQAHKWQLAATLLALPAAQTVELRNWGHQDVFQHCDIPEVIGRLLDLGVSPNEIGQRGSALYHATETLCNPGVVRLLLERGAEVGKFWVHGRTTLGNAIARGNLEVARMLIDAGEQLWVLPPPEQPLPAGMTLLPNRGIQNGSYQQEAGRAEPGPWQWLDSDKKTKAIKKEVVAHALARGQQPFEGTTVRTAGSKAKKPVRPAATPPVASDTPILLAELVYDDAEINDASAFRNRLELSVITKSYPQCRWIEIGPTPQFRWMNESRPRNRPDKLLTDDVQPIVLFIPGGHGVQAQLENQPLLDWLRKIVPGCGTVVAITDGQLLLARAALLDGVEIALYAPRQEQMRQLAPNVIVLPDADWHESGKFLSRRDRAPGMAQLTYRIAERTFGTEFARKLRPRINSWDR